MFSRIFGKFFNYQVTLCEQVFHITPEEQKINKASRYPIRAGVGKNIGHYSNAVFFVENMLMPEALKGAGNHSSTK